MHINCHVARAVGLFVAVATLACATTRHGVSITSTPAARSQAATVDWAGTYDLVGTGFPEGERRAQLVVARNDTTHVVRVAGPPGRLVSFWFVDDSALVVWGLPEQLMEVRLRHHGDSLRGSWQIAEHEGAIRGARVR